MIQKSYTLGFFNSYLGMAWAAFIDKLLVNVCGLLLSVLMLKQIIMNLIDLFEPQCKEPKRYKKHKLQIQNHYTRFPDDYSTQADNIQDKLEHYEAERQTLMADMAPHLVPQYNELFMQLGWILFFSMTFPVGAFFTVFAGLIRMSIELTGMSEYKKKNEPASIIDIGIWMDLLEFVASLGILVCIYLIVFTSKKLTLDMPYDDATMYFLAFVALHTAFFIKFFLQEVIEDEPGWISERREVEENRVAQVEKDNQDKKLWERLSEHYSEMDLLFEVLEQTHKDLNKSAQLVPKIKEGCEAWLRANQQTKECSDTQQLMMAKLVKQEAEEGSEKHTYVSRDV